MSDWPTDEAIRVTHLIISPAHTTWGRGSQSRERERVRRALVAALDAAPTVDVKCPHCGDGRLYAEGAQSWDVCPTCDGAGTVRALLLGPEVQT